MCQRDGKELQRRCCSHPLKTRWTLQKNKNHVQPLEYPEWAKAEFCTEYWEIVVEEGHGPRDLRKEEESELGDDQKTVEDGPEDTCGLIGDGATSEGRYVRINMTVYQIPEDETEAYPM
jgi:hypothetical protein